MIKQNFDGNYSPRVSLVYSGGESKHNLEVISNRF
jgi:hypothetical protein